MAWVGEASGPLGPLQHPVTRVSVVAVVQQHLAGAEMCRARWTSYAVLMRHARAVCARSWFTRRNMGDSKPRTQMVVDLTHPRTTLDGHSLDLLLGRASAEPALRSLRSLVEAVCTDPWSIRRPHHLAIRCRMSLAAVKRQCVSAGFARVEHCILCIRLLAYEQLVVVEHMPARRARLLAGFDDPSNMRRHVRRAAGRSPLVARALEALPANA